MKVVHHQRMDQSTIRSRRAAVAGFSAMSTLIGVVMPSVEACAQTRFTLVPPPVGSYNLGITGISDDGQNVAGYASGPGAVINRNIGVLQRPGRSLELFGQFGGTVSQGLWGISGDGRYVIGSQGVDSISPVIGFRATNSASVVTLPVLPTYRSTIPEAVNHDGSVVVGYASRLGSLSRQQAFRWTPLGGIQGLGYLRANSPFQSRALAVSADGNTIAGVSVPEYNTGMNETFVWRPETGMQLLPAPQGAASEAAYSIDGMSRNGRFILGRWTRDRQTVLSVMWDHGVPIELGSLPDGSPLYANAVSEDGSLVAGSGGPWGGVTAAVWTPSRGVLRLDDFALEQGLSLPSGVQLVGCDAMTPDGKTFAGTCTYNGQTMGYVVSIPAPGIGAWLMLTGVVVQRRRR